MALHEYWRKRFVEMVERENRDEGPFGLKITAKKINGGKFKKQSVLLQFRVVNKKGDEIGIPCDDVVLSENTSLTLSEIAESFVIKLY